MGVMLILIFIHQYITLLW